MMEEVGGHEDVVEPTSLPDAHTDEAVISDALQDAAQTNVTEGLDKQLPISTNVSSVSSGYGVGYSTSPPKITPAPNLENVSSFPTVPGASYTMSAPRFTAAPNLEQHPVAPFIPSLSDMTSGPPPFSTGAVPSVPIMPFPVNVSTPPKPSSYHQTPQFSGTPASNHGLSNVGSVSAVPSGMAAPPPTGGFVPAHGIVSATPGKHHHSSIPVGPPSTLASHIFTPSTVTQSETADVEGSSGTYSTNQSMSQFTQQPAPSFPSGYNAQAYSSYEPAVYPLETQTHQQQIPTTPQKSEGFFGWLPGSGLMHRVIEKTKSSVESVITTLDPGMKDVIYSGGSINIVVTSTKDVKVGAIRQAFQSVFGRATVIGMECQPNIAPQPVGYSAGVRGAEERIMNLRQSGNLDERQTIVSVENFLVELVPDKWFDVGCVLLKDPLHGIDLMSFTQATPVPNEYVTIAQDATSPNYPLRWSGFALTVGQAIQQRMPHIDQADWHVQFTGVSRREMIAVAARTLAGIYRTQLPPDVMQ